MVLVKRIITSLKLINSEAKNGWIFFQSFEKPVFLIGWQSCCWVVFLNLGFIVVLYSSLTSRLLLIGLIFKIILCNLCRLALSWILNSIVKEMDNRYFLHLPPIITDSWESWCKLPMTGRPGGAGEEGFSYGFLVSERRGKEDRLESKCKGNSIAVYTMKLSLKILGEL